MDTENKYGVWVQNNTYMVLHYSKGWTLEDTSAASSSSKILMGDLTLDKVKMWLRVMGIDKYQSVENVEGEK